MASSILHFETTLPLTLLGHDLSRSAAYLLLPLSLLYSSLYFSLLGHNRVYGALTLATLAAFGAVAAVAQVRCPPAASLVNFAGMPPLPPTYQRTR